MIILMLFLAIVFSLVSFFVYKKAKSFNSSKKLTFVILSFVIFALGLELTIFNVNFYNTRGNEEISLNQYMSYNVDSNNHYTLTADNNILYFPEIETEIENIYINVISSPYKNTPLKIKLSDEANTVTFETPERVLSAKVKKSQYIMNNAINEIQNTLEAANSRITEAEDRISEVEDRISEVEERRNK